MAFFVNRGNGVVDLSQKKIVGSAVVLNLGIVSEERSNGIAIFGLQTQDGVLLQTLLKDAQFAFFVYKRPTVHPKDAPGRTLLKAHIEMGNVAALEVGGAGFVSRYCVFDGQLPSVVRDVALPRHRCFFGDGVALHDLGTQRYERYVHFPRKCFLLVLLAAPRPFLFWLVTMYAMFQGFELLLALVEPMLYFRDGPIIEKAMGAETLMEERLLLSRRINPQLPCVGDTFGVRSSGR